MPATRITFGNDEAKFVLQQRVSIRQKWSDDWELVPEVHCTSALFATSPSISEASIYYRYGVGRLPIDQGLNQKERFELPRLGYVRIEFEAYNPAGDIEVGVWYGVVGSLVERAEGGRIHWSDDPNVAPAPVPSGYQQFQCAGMDWLLESHYIMSAVVNNLGSNATVDAAPAFGNNKDPGKNVFARKTKHSDEATPWSTRDVVKYLVEHLTPRDHNNIAQVQWEVENEQLLPDWDEVSMAQTGYTVGSLLKRLISRQRGLGYFIDVRDNKAKLIVFTFTHQDIDLGNGRTLLKNPISDLNITLSADRTGQSTFVYDSFSRYDRVIAIGERATMTFTAAPVQVSEATADIRAQLDESIADIDPGDTEARSDHIARFSANPNVVRHSTLYRLDVGTKTNSPAAGSDGFIREHTFLQDKFILPRTRLLVGEDYGGDNRPDPKVPPNPDLEHQYMRPQMWGDDPDNDNTIHMTHGAASPGRDAKRSNADLRASNDSWMSVEISYPEAIYSWVDGNKYGGELRALLGDRNLPVPANCEITATIELDHFCEGVADNNPNVDIAREKFIFIGGGRYRLDFLAKDTIVGVDPGTGEAITHNKDELIRDDREAIKDIAALAFSWYGTERLAVRFGTNWINSSVVLGAMILNIVDGDTEYAVNSPVTHLAIESPVSELKAAVPKISYRTSYGELDVIAATEGIGG